MTAEIDQLRIEVALGRRVMVLGDILLPRHPSPSSLATCRDIAHTLAEWSGPGVVVICGQLVAAGGADSPPPAAALEAHPDLMAAFAAFAQRPESRVVLVVGALTPPDDLAVALRACGVTLETGVDLHCVTGAGEREVRILAGTPATEPNQTPEVAVPVEDRPWLVGMERLEDPLLAPRFVRSRLLYRRLRHYLWAPPLVLALIALALRLEFVIDGLGHIFRSPRQQRALQQAYAASWFSRLLVTILIGVALLAVLALVVAVTSRGIWRALGGETLPSPWSWDGAPTQGAPASAHSLLSVDGESVLDAARSAIAEGATGLIVGGALIAELTHLDAGFFACPGAASEIVREHRARFGLPPTYLHHRRASLLEIETGADLHVRLTQAEVDLPLATWGERLLTHDAVVKGRAKAADLYPELVASWPSGASWPPAPEVAADRIRVRRIRRLAATALFVAGLIDLLSAVTAPVRHRLHLISTFLPIEVARAAGALVAISGIAMIMLSRGVLKGQRRSWLVAVAALAASLVLHVVHAADVITLVVCAGVLALFIVQRERFRGPGRTRHGAIGLRRAGCGWSDRNRGRFHRGRGRQPGSSPPSSDVASGPAGFGGTPHRRKERALSNSHRSLRLPELAGGRPDAHRSFLLSPDAPGGRSATFGRQGRRGAPCR